MNDSTGYLSMRARINLFLLLGFLQRPFHVGQGCLLLLLLLLLNCITVGWERRHGIVGPMLWLLWLLLRSIPRIEILEQLFAKYRKRIRCHSG